MSTPSSPDDELVVAFSDVAQELKLVEEQRALVASFQAQVDEYTTLRDAARTELATRIGGLRAKSGRLNEVLGRQAPPPPVRG
jgi:predicted RNA-binding Zn ribbon-like protein